MSLRPLAEVGESIPGWAVVALALALLALLIGARALDLFTTVTRGVEAGVSRVVERVEVVDYEEVARWVWGAVTTFIGILLLVAAVAKMVNAVVKVGEEE